MSLNFELHITLDEDLTRKAAYLLAGHSVSVDAGADALRPLKTGISRFLDGAKGLGGLGENFSVTGRPLL